jgi:hypothetical protein
MKKLQLFSLLVAGTMMASTFTACSEDEETPAAVTKVTAISPTTVAQGADITVTGENLDLTTAVSLGTTALAKKDGATATTFVVTVPETFAAGVATLKITWEGGEKTEPITVTASSVEDKVIKITDVSPTSVVQGEDITVTGENLDLTTTITLGATALAKKDGATTTTFAVTVPADFAEGATTLTIAWEGASETTNITVTKAEGGDPIIPPLPPCPSDEGYFTIACFEGAEVGARLKMATYDNNAIHVGSLAAVALNPSDATKQVALVHPGTYGDLLQLNVTLPDGKTLGDYDKFYFDLIYDGTDYKQARIYIDDEKVYTDDGYPQQSTGIKEYATLGWSEAAKAKSSFTITFGVVVSLEASVDGKEYYIDNVRLHEKTIIDGEVTTCANFAGYLLLDCFNALVLNADYTKSSRYSSGMISTVVQNPTESTEKAVQVITKNWDDYFSITATLASGKTAADYDSLVFDIYYNSDAEGAANDYKSFYANFGSIDYDNLDYISNWDGDAGAGGTASAAPGWQTKAIAIPAKNLGSEFNIILGPRGDATNYYINNVRLKEK